MCSFVLCLLRQLSDAEHMPQHEADEPLPLTMTTFIKYRSFPRSYCAQHRYAECDKNHGGDEQHEPCGEICASTMPSPNETAHSARSFGPESRIIAAFRHSHRKAPPFTEAPLRGHSSIYGGASFGYGLFFGIFFVFRFGQAALNLALRRFCRHILRHVDNDERTADVHANFRAVGDDTVAHAH